MPFRAFMPYKSSTAHMVRVCGTNSVVSRANDVLAESTTCFTAIIKTLHSTYYRKYFTSIFVVIIGME